MSSSTASNSRRAWLRSPLFLCCVALALRLLVITVGHTYRITPRGDHFQFGWEMGRIARSIATGHGFSSPLDIPTGPTAWAPPLYPYLMGGVFKVFGVYTRASAWVILAFNSIFSALTCLTIYRIGARLFGDTPARWAAWTWALFPYEIYWPVRVVWETSLSTFLLSLAFLLMLRLEDEPRPRDSALLGLLWGTIALTNATMLSFLPLSLLWLWWRRRGRTPAAISHIALALLLCAAVVTPWLLRNYRTFGRFVFIRDNLGLELQVANNPESGGYWGRDEHPGNSPREMRLFATLGEIDYMHTKQREAVAFIRAHPLTFAGYFFRRAAFFWIGNPQFILFRSYTLGPARHMAFLITALLAFAGLYLCARDGRKGTFLFAALLLLFPLPYYIAHPAPRYRNAIEPEMMLLTMYVFYKAQGRTFAGRRNLHFREDARVAVP